LTAFTVDAQNASYSSLSGVLFNKSQTTLIEYPGGVAGAYTIPGSVTSIGSGAFASCSGLTSISIPSSVTSIEDGAFLGCSGLTNVTIPNGVTSIGQAAFEGCSGLTNVTIASSVTSIEFDAFNWCYTLMSAYFQGDAPSSFDVAVFGNTAWGFTIYYPVTATGWTTPTWNGYPALPYDYAQSLPVLAISVSMASGVATLFFNNLQLGTNYQLQVSGDLKMWSDSGTAFTATNTSQVYPQPFAVTNSNQLFFRLSSAP
jgi:hypothetical protein